MTDPAVDPSTRVRRGLWLNLLIAFEVVQGLTLAAAGSILVAARNDRQVRVDLEGTAAGVGAVGTFIAVVGLIHLVVAVGLLRRSEMVRSFLAGVATIQAAVATFALISRQDVRLAGAVPFAASILILWVLYGSPRAQEYFES